MQEKPSEKALKGNNCREILGASIARPPKCVFKFKLPYKKIQ